MKRTVSWMGGDLDTSVQGRCAAPLSEQPPILIVDDDQRMRDSVCDLLQAYGYPCLLAAGGEAALQILAEHPIDLVLMDLNMPGMDGHQAMRRVAKAYPATDVIVVSGETTFENATQALRDGAQDFIRKPYAPDDLLQVLRRTLEKRALKRDVERMQRSLQASEHRYRFIVNNSPDIVYMLDDQGCFAFINDRITGLLGFEPEELVGRHYTELVHKEDRDKARFAFDERRTGRRATHNIEFRLLCKNDVVPYRYFESRSITIELSSMGVYTEDSVEPQQQFVGTYGVARDISERKRAEEIINFQLYHDLLTKLPNRALFRDRLQQAIALAQRNKSQLAVMYLDMDRFKVINDSLGHLAGDQLLQTVASRLQSCLRDSDTLARVGGDEFNLLLPEIAESADAAMIADKIIDTVKTPIVLEGYEVFVSFSIGIAVFPDDGPSMEQLIKNADMAMYHIKGRGKNGYEFYADNMKALFQQQLTLENGIRKALDEEQFELFYQPQVDLCSSRVLGMEALIRWHHPERGLVLPDEFIPLSEELGLIVDIGSWVIDRACAELRRWLDAGASEQVVMAVNISAAQLEQPGFERVVMEALQRHRIPANQLELEITENTLMQDMEQAVHKFQRLALQGVRVAVDDFGTGYSSLSYLQSLPLNTLKIDRTFISAIESSKQRNSIVTAIFAMARELNLDTIAEGVETDAQLDYLERLGCLKVQGYLLGYPLATGQALQRLLATP